MAACNALSTATSGCAINDGTSAGQWRLPNINELHSLGPTWPLGGPFQGYLSSYYWLSTSLAFFTDNAWNVYFSNGNVSSNYKYATYYVRYVCGGQ